MIFVYLVEKYALNLCKKLSSYACMLTPLLCYLTVDAFRCSCVLLQYY